MKKVFLIMLLGLSLFAKESCYSVEIFKDKYTTKNLQKVNAMQYDKSCIKAKLQDNIAVRCGCYKTEEELKKNLQKFKKQYKNAKESITYAYRFKKLQKQKVKPKVEKKIDKNKECYTVEIKQLSIYEIDSLDNIDDGCAKIKVKKSAIIGCGCFDTAKEVIIKYRELKKKYNDAHINKIKEFKYINYLDSLNKKSYIKKDTKKQNISISSLLNSNVEKNTTNKKISITDFIDENDTNITVNPLEISVSEVKSLN